MAFCLVAMTGMSNVSYAATVGDSLSEPESGWERIDDSNSIVVGTGDLASSLSDTSGYTYNSTCRQSQNIGDTITFQFYGSKFRLSGCTNNNHSDNIQVAVDGVINGYFSQNTTSVIAKRIDYEVLNLELSYHTVTITLMTNAWYVFDSIDISENGNKAILEITMTNGNIKEYDFAIDELNYFLIWYDNRSEGIGKAYYCIIKKNNIKPFLNRKEYLSFDKISSFEVKDYNE
ncbi:MAG: hypothetical protein ACERKN_09655 [Velocimicrobium sp.]